MRSITENAIVPPLAAITELLASVSPELLKNGALLVEKNRISNVEIRERGVTADVMGSYNYPYHVLIAAGSEPQCRCTCPAADYMAVCKHAVAVALQLSQSNDVPQETGDEQLLRRYFQQKQSDELITLLLQLVRGDKNLMSEWLCKATLAFEPPSLKQIKKMVAKALPMRKAWDWNEAAQYFFTAELQLDNVWMVMERLSIDEQWLLSWHILQRLEEVLELIDDSGDRVSIIQEQLFGKMSQIFEKLDWPAAKKAQWLFDCLDNTEYEIAPMVGQHFIATGEVQTYLLKLCYDAFETLAAELNHTDQESELSWQMSRYAGPLVKAAQQSGNWREELRLRSLLAGDYHDYLALSESCLAHQEELEAEAWLLKAKKEAKGDHQQALCCQQEIRIRIALGEHKSAWKMAWVLFAQQPDYNHYQKLLAVHEELGQPEPELLAKVEQVLLGAPHLQTALLEFYLERHEIAKATGCIQAGGGSREQILRLADMQIVNQPAEALALYLRVVEDMINGASYEQAAKLLLQLQAQLRENQHSVSDFDNAVAQLATEFRRKRNMMALLKQHFPSCL